MEQAPVIKCPFCELIVESQKILEHHITWTLEPNHPKIEEYLREHKPKHQVQQTRPVTYMGQEQELQQQQSRGIPMELSSSVTSADIPEDESSSPFIETTTLNKEPQEEASVPELKLLRLEGFEIEQKLSFVTLTDDKRGILLNGEYRYKIIIPKYLDNMRSKGRQEVISSLILDGCDKYNFDYVNPDNIANCAKEVVGVMFERAGEESALLAQQEAKKGKEEEKKKKDILLKHESKADKVERLANTLENRYFFASIVTRSAQGNSRSNDPLYYYDKDKDFYQPAEGLVKAKLEQIESNVITETVTNIIQKLARRHQHHLEEFDADINVLNLRNGLYNLDRRSPARQIGRPPLQWGFQCRSFEKRSYMSLL